MNLHPLNPASIGSHERALELIENNISMNNELISLARTTNDLGLLGRLTAQIEKTQGIVKRLKQDALMIDLKHSEIF